MAIDMKLKLRSDKPKQPKAKVGEAPVFDLMPPSRRGLIETAEAKSRWTRIVIIVAAVCVVAVVALFGVRTINQISYDQKLGEQTTLDGEIAALDETAQVLATETSVKELAARVGGTELDWVGIYDRIYGALPSGSTVGSIYIKSGTATGLAAAVNVEVISPSVLDYADVLEAFKNIPGVSQLDVGGITAGSDRSGSSYRYTVAFGLDNTVFTNKWTLDAPEEVVE